MHNPFGDLCYLLAASGKYNKWTFGKIKHYFLPPIQAGQYFAFRNGDLPIGFITYAYVNDALLAKLLCGKQAVQPDQWNSGELLFFPDMVAPFGNVKAMMRQVQQQMRQAHGDDYRGYWYRPAKKKVSHAAT